MIIDLYRLDECSSHDIDLLHVLVNPVVPCLASLPTPWPWSHRNRFFHHAISNLVVRISSAWHLSDHVVMHCGLVSVFSLLTNRGCATLPS